jgi:hypothetical protein
MTVIAYDGLYVAADRMISNDSGMRGITRKLEVWEDQVLATCGAADHGEAMVIWFKDGKDPAAFPHTADKGGEKSAYLYVFKLNCPVMCFQTWPAPILFPMTEFAAGCGSEIARTAMHLGRDAREAAKIATELNVFCGMGVEFIDLSELAATGMAAVRSYLS